ncbi:PH domain-containing protein [Bacteroides acidifaciens]|uniref:PH domain-containing protein n=1 Tax=Bacteroides acidifaciens TaxID=85831 RepID=UPI002557D006|nr:PH domain-containing protein [Bacteroides acidifaciens]
MFRYLYRKTTYVIDDNVLRISTPLKSLAINIDSIKKIRRGKFWVESRRNYSAAYIKLRIIYDRSSYVYVSPEDEESFVNTLQAINPNIEYSSERGLKS